MLINELPIKTLEYEIVWAADLYTTTGCNHSNHLSRHAMDATYCTHAALDEYIKSRLGLSADNIQHADGFNHIQIRWAGAAVAHRSNHVVG